MCVCEILPVKNLFHSLTLPYVFAVIALLKLLSTELLRYFNLVLYYRISRVKQCLKTCVAFVLCYDTVSRIIMADMRPASVQVSEPPPPRPVRNDSKLNITDMAMDADVALPDSFGSQLDIALAA
jgi:hypothetical protein